MGKLTLRPGESRLSVKRHKVLISRKSKVGRGCVGHGFDAFQQDGWKRRRKPVGFGEYNDAGGAKVYIGARVGRDGSCIFQGRGRPKEREENAPGGCWDCTTDMVSIGCGVISWLSYQVD